MAQSVSTGRWQPVDAFNLLGAKFYTVGDFLKALMIILAAASLGIKQFTGDAGEVDFIAVKILELGQAAASAAIAQGLPFLGVEIIEGAVFPKPRG